MGKFVHFPAVVNIKKLISEWLGLGLGLDGDVLYVYYQTDDKRQG